MQRPFYPEGATAHVYMLHPPGGVVAGDALHVDMRVDEGAAGLVTTPGATKFYRSEGLTARLQQRLAASGHLEWFPQENIFFNDSHVALETQVHIDSAATLAFWEINCFGRLAGKQPFVKGDIATKLTLYKNNHLILHDRFVVNSGQALQRTTGLRGHSVSAILLLTPLPTESVEPTIALLDGKAGFSVTCIDNVLIVRYIGDSAEQAKEGFTMLWSHHRMALSKRDACVPRIWAT